MAHRALTALLTAWTAAACAAPATTITGRDPLLQAQFAQPRCWASPAGAWQWARAGLQGAQAATGGPRWAPAAGPCVTDRATGLVWATGAVQDDLPATDVDGVAARARELGLCGHADWRLPARAELSALIDYRALSADALPGLSADHHRVYWTATPQARDPQGTARGSRFTVTLSSGAVRIERPEARHSVLLVRDGACRALGRAWWW